MLTKEITTSRFDAFSAEDLVRWADRKFGDGLVVSSSFGIQSAVTLHLTTRVRPQIPVVWVDTGYLPDETLHYVEVLTSLLDLNLTVAKSPMSPAEMESRFGRLWESDDVADLDLYDSIRKVEPMQRALASLNATARISGLRADQTDYRRKLPRAKKTSSTFMVHPILNWTNRQVYRYMQEHELPQHPLFEQGYTTVGDAHSSRPVTAFDTNDRATRFQGLKQECGLHVDSQRGLRM